MFTYFRFLLLLCMHWQGALLGFPLSRYWSTCRSGALQPVWTFGQQTVVRQTPRPCANHGVSLPMSVCLGLCPSHWLPRLLELGCTLVLVALLGFHWLLAILCYYSCEHTPLGQGPHPVRWDVSYFCFAVFFGVCVCVLCLKCS